MIFRRRMSQPCFRSCATSFGPVVRARSSASACVRPPRDVRKSRSSCSLSFRAASRTAGETWICWFFSFVGIGSRFGGDDGPVGLDAAVSESLSAGVGGLMVKLYAPRAIFVAGVSSERPCTTVKSDGQMKCSRHRILVPVVRMRTAELSCVVCLAHPVTPDCIL